MSDGTTCPIHGALVEPRCQLCHGAEVRRRMNRELREPTIRDQCQFCDQPHETAVALQFKCPPNPRDPSRVLLSVTKGEDPPPDFDHFTDHWPRPESRVCTAHMLLLFDGFNGKTEALERLYQDFATKIRKLVERAG